MDLLTSLNIFTAADDEYEKFFEELSEISSSKPVGFFKTDASVQTDESELPAVQTLSETTVKLIQELDVLKKDISVKLKFIKSQYESRLQQEADGFYTKISDKVRYLERHHKERTSVLRRSYQQQFNSAIAVLKANFKKYYMRQSGNTMEVDPCGSSSRLKQLMDEIAELNFKIECMREELKYKENEKEPEEDIEKKYLHSENAKLRDNMDNLHIEMEQIKDLLDTKEEHLEHLVSEIEELQDKAVENKKAMQQMASDREQLQVHLARERDSAVKVAALKEEMEKEKQAMEESNKNDQSKELHLVQETDVRVQQAEVSTPIQVERGTEELKEQISSLKKVNIAHKIQIQRLQMQLSHSSKVWEKKFHIMRQSFYAIKDEMYLRQTLQRQAASLQVASVSYTMDTPLSPFNNGPKPPYNSIKTHLPSIRLPRIAGRNLSPDNRLTDPSGTEDLCYTEPGLLGSDEDEDADDEYPGVLPLPRPPTHVRQTEASDQHIIT
ncbi:uncharacterized protein C10orf67 homolog, mitochondrial [Centroberyx gerrardi]